MSDIQKKSDAELLGYVKEKQEDLRKLRFGMAGSGMRNSHIIRDTRREVAQGLTEIGARQRKEA